MERISKFFARLGFPLRNSRWSWGGHSALGVLLTTWTDDLDSDGHFVRVLGWKSDAPRNPSTGRDERVDHLRALWSGGLPGYVVIATAKDVNARPRAIQTYDDKAVRAIVSLDVRHDGSIWAELGDNVLVARLKKHSAQYRLIPADNPFPIERTAQRRKPKPSNAAYVAQIPAMREWLIELARARGTATYAQARAPFGLRTLEHRHAMDRIGHECLDAGEPVLTSLIVDEETGRCSSGFFKEFRRDDVQEREDCFTFWRMDPATAPGGKDGAGATGSDGQQHRGIESLRARAAQFAKVAVRPEQAAFRRRVFQACGGVCVVTGCAVDAALDAAHRKGRDWKSGHNLATDGILLRKDIHALYDAGLVEIDGRNIAVFASHVAAHYASTARKG